MCASKSKLAVEFEVLEGNMISEKKATMMMVSDAVGDMHTYIRIYPSPGRQHLVCVFVLLSRNLRLTFRY